jgi:hypothetical protein
MTKSQNGNVLFYILIAVALIAALSYAVSQSSRGGGDAISDQKVALFSGEMIDYGNVLANAVGQLRLRGCQITQISFQNDVDASYTNAGAPADGSCSIFHPNGGGVNFMSFEAEAFLRSNPGYIFNASMQIQNLGSTCSNNNCTDLLFLARDLKQSVCLTLNDTLSVTNPGGVPPIETELDYAAFTGAYTNVQTIGDVAAASSVAGKSAGCVEDDNSGEFVFYKVLHRR